MTHQAYSNPLQCKQTWQTPGKEQTELISIKLHWSITA